MFMAHPPAQYNVVLFPLLFVFQNVIFFLAYLDLFVYLFYTLHVLVWCATIGDERPEVFPAK